MVPQSATLSLQREMKHAERIEAKDKEHVCRILELKTRERVRVPQKENLVQGILTEAREKSTSPPSSLAHLMHNIWRIRSNQVQK